MAKPGSVPSPAGIPITLAYNQFIMGVALAITDLVPTPYINPIVVGPLGVGMTAHLIDPQTGAPFLITPKGFKAILVEYSWTCNQDIEIAYFFDGMFGAHTIGQSGDFKMIDPAYAISSALYDPQGQSAHVWDVVIKNKGLDVLLGGIDYVFLLQDIGTPPLPTVKDCTCPFCGNVQSLPVETTRVVCSKCGKLYMLRYYPKNKVLMGGH